MRAVLLGVALTAGIPTMLEAQQGVLLREGLRVEVTPMRGLATRGTLTSISADSLIVARDSKSQGRVAFDVRNVSKVRVSTGRNHLRAGLLGGLGGTFLGLMIGTLTSKDEPVDAAAGAGAGAMLGLIGGSILGGMRGTEKWEQASVTLR